MFDGAPLGEVVKAVGTSMGAQVRVCSGGDRPVSGRFQFENSAAIAPMLMEKGYPVSSGSGGSIEVGCDAAAQEFSGAVVPAFPGQAATSSAPTVSQAQSAPPPPPSVYARVDLRYRDPSKVIAAVSKLPGLSVLSFPDVPGPMLLAGPASIVSEAKSFIAALDTCPAQVRVEALVVTKGEQVRRDRRFGVQFGDGDSLVGTSDPSAASMIRVPGLRAFLSAMRERGEFRTNRSFIGDVVLGGTVSLRDGSEIPVQAGTIITDRETRNNVTYRDVGHNLSFSLLAMADGYAVLNLNHEISSLVGNSSLGPTFAKQSTESIMRLRLGAWEMISLSGTDTAERTKGRGIFSRSDGTASERNGAYLVFALAAVPCTPLTAGEYVEPARQGGAGRGDLHEAGKPSKKRS